MWCCQQPGSPGQIVSANVDTSHDAKAVNLRSFNRDASPRSQVQSPARKGKSARSLSARSKTPRRTPQRYDLVSAATVMCAASPCTPRTPHELEPITPIRMGELEPKTPPIANDTNIVAQARPEETPAETVGLERWGMTFSRVAPKVESSLTPTPRSRYCTPRGNLPSARNRPPVDRNWAVPMLSARISDDELPPSLQFNAPPLHLAGLDVMSRQGSLNSPGTFLSGEDSARSMEILGEECSASHAVNHHTRATGPGAVITDEEHEHIRFSESISLGPAVDVMRYGHSEDELKELVEFQEESPLGLRAMTVLVGAH